MTRRRIAACAVLAVLAGAVAAASVGTGGTVGTGGADGMGKTDGGQNEDAGRGTGPPTQSLHRADTVVARFVDRYTVDRSFTGSVVARRTSDLGFERSARVIAVAVDEGDPVDRGQTLAELDARQIEIRRKQTLARRQEAVAILDELRAGPRTETIGAARAALNDANARVELQRRSFDRVGKLLLQNATSKDAFDAAELGFQSSEAQRDAARQRLDELEAGSRKEQIAAQEAVVAQLDAMLEDIEVDLRDSVLVAPYSGTISRREVDEGTVVTPSQTLLRLVESGVLEARIGIPATMFEHLRKGAPFEITVEQRSYPTTLIRTLPDVDLQTRTRVAVFAFAPEAADHIVPGQVARIRIGQQQPTEGFWVPTTALVRSYRGLWAVFVAEPMGDDRFRIRRCDVELLHSEGDRALVRGLLSDGDRVVRSGAHRLVPQQAVRIRTE